VLYCFPRQGEFLGVVLFSSLIVHRKKSLLQFLQCFVSFMSQLSDLGSFTMDASQGEDESRLVEGVVSHSLMATAFHRH
jgi:hypothetical protein